MCGSWLSVCCRFREQGGIVEFQTVGKLEEVCFFAYWLFFFIFFFQMKYLSLALNGINTAFLFLYINILLLYIVLNFYGCYQIAFFSFASNC